MLALAIGLNATVFEIMDPMLFRGYPLVTEERPAVAILDYQVWEPRPGKRPDVVGSIVHVNGAPATIIGVKATPGLKDIAGIESSASRRAIRSRWRRRRYCWSWSRGSRAGCQRDARGASA